MAPRIRWHVALPEAARPPSGSLLDEPVPFGSPDAGRLGRLPVTEGNDVQLRVGGHEVLPRVLSAIASAKETIHIESMLFFHDDAGYQVRDALLRRLDETKGRVRVRVLYDYLATVVGDPFLSKGTNPLQLTTFMAPLRGAGAEVIDTSFSNDQDPERMARLESLTPRELRESILNFPYEVRRTYRWMHAGVLRVIESKRWQRRVQRLLEWGEKYDTEYAEYLSPHRLISRYSVHDHRKIMVFDGKLAFCGGMNVGQEYLYRHAPDPKVDAEEAAAQPGSPEPWIKWHDTCCEVRGPAVRALQRCFLDQYERCGGAPLDDRDREQCFPNFPKEPDPAGDTGGMRVAVVRSIPGRPSEIEREALALIARASDRILLRNPYLVRSGFVRALFDAARRGAVTRLVLSDDHNDSFIHQAYMRSWYPVLREAEAVIREHQHLFSHCKALSVDGRRSLMGSFNYNNRSSTMDFECGLVVDDGTFAADVERRLHDEEVAAGVALPARDPGSDDLRRMGQTLLSLGVFEVSSTFL